MSPLRTPSSTARVSQKRRQDGPALSFDEVVEVACVLGALRVHEPSLGAVLPSLIDEGSGR
jgi:hypothetical protein